MQLARFEQLLGRLRELLDAGDALAAGKIDHRRREIGAAAVDRGAPHHMKPISAQRRCPAWPSEPNARGRFAMKPSSARHDAAPAQELQRLLGPRQHGFGDLLGFRGCRG